MLLILILIKVVAVLLRGPAPIVRDAEGYWEMSSLVLEGDLLMVEEPIAYRTPGYPWLLATIRFASGSWALPMVIVAQGALLIMTSALAAVLAWQLTGERFAATLALLAMLPTISAATYAAAVLTETLFTTLLTAHLVSIIHYSRRPTTGSAAWAAVSFAAALLTRPIVMLLWVPHLALLVAAKAGWFGATSLERLSWRRLWVHLTVSAIVIIGAAAPWLARNQRLFGELFLTEFVGRNLWVVAFQPGSGTGLALPDTDASEELRRRVGPSLVAGISERWRLTWTVSQALTESGLDDAAADRLMKHVALDAISDAPLAFVKKAIRRVVNFWRAAATDLPMTPREVELVERRAGLQPSRAGANAYCDQRVWAVQFPPLEVAIDNRWSGYVGANSVLTLLVVAANVLLIAFNKTRPYGIWIAAIFAYFAVLTGVLEIPHYRYRLVIEPLAAATIAAAVSIAWSRLPTRDLVST